jgi:pimeloyl-ACP methyl ester carboxylesterase
MRRRATLALALLISCVAGCGGGGGGHGHTASTRSATPVAPELAPRLTGRHPCPDAHGFTCATLAVPLDHAGQASGTLRLAIGYAPGASAPRGVLVFLSGGPGQPGIPFLNRIRRRLGAQMHGYRLVMFDQRGTGAGALNCPALQKAAGSSDLVVPPPGAVPACAASIGSARRFYTTAETVADLDSLRLAMHASRLTLDGVSYGTFVAERYALAYPRHVARLVLDSVVPQQGPDALYVAALQRSGPVLRSVCTQQHCGFDPARDLATVVRTRHDGPALLNALVAESVAFPSYQGIPQALHAAARGNPGGLDELLAGVRRGEAASADALSQGLHESTVCVELAPPWDPAARPAARTRTMDRAAAALTPAQVYPFDRATARGNGLVQGCLQWPATTPPDLPSGNAAGDLPPVPVLLYSGQRDLSTPPAWARQEAAKAPRGRLVSVPGAGHSVQLHAADPAVRRILGQFLGS